MERLFGCEDRDGNPVKAVTKKGMDKSVVLIRYADDFLVTAPSKEILEQHVLPNIEAFLAERGLALNQEKTRIVSIDEGFNFLGFTARKFRNGKLLIMPGEGQGPGAPAPDQGVSRTQNKQAPAGAVVRDLTPIIRGWTLYYRHACSARTFQYADHRVWQMLWAWARRRHPTKSKRWVKARYFRPTRSRVWNFADAVGARDGHRSPGTATPRSSATRRSRGAPAPWTRTPDPTGTSGGGRDWRPAASPERRQELLRTQGYACAECGVPFDPDEDVGMMDAHHVKPRHTGRRGRDGEPAPPASMVPSSAPSAGRV